MKNELKTYEQWKAETTKDFVDGVKAVTLFILLVVLVGVLK